MRIDSRFTKFAYAAVGLIAGGVLVLALGAQAATPSPSGTSSSSSAEDSHPGDDGADGVPESEEHHGGHGGTLDLSGTVTVVGTSSVTIKTSSGTMQYAVTSSSDIDKSGEAKLSDLKAGDAVTFSVDDSNAKQIDKLHAGDESKNVPQHQSTSSSSSSSSNA